jgi:hypothetical protein
MVAFAITAYDDEQESIEDPSYGEIKAYYKTWGLIEGQSTNFEELPSRICTRAELGLEKEDGDDVSDYSKAGRLFETHKNSINDLKYYYKKLKCVETERL